MSRARVGTIIDISKESDELLEKLDSLFSLVNGYPSREELMEVAMCGLEVATDFQNAAHMDTREIQIAMAYGLESLVDPVGVQDLSDPDEYVDYVDTLRISLTKCVKQIQSQAEGLCPESYYNHGVERIGASSIAIWYEL